MVVAWLLMGPALGWTDTWQLLINTPTTVLTFLLAVLISATQNTQDAAMHAKLDVIIAALEQAPNRFQAIEEKTDEELSEIKKEVKEDG
jgi:low affinity Fe/Cu permease